MCNTSGIQHKLLNKDSKVLDDTPLTTNTAGIKQPKHLNQTDGKLNSEAESKEASSAEEENTDSDDDEASEASEPLSEERTVLSEEGENVKENQDEITQEKLVEIANKLDSEDEEDVDFMPGDADADEGDNAVQRQYSLRDGLLLQL